jgi:hypothetical protein
VIRASRGPKAEEAARGGPAGSGPAAAEPESASAVAAIAAGTLTTQTVLNPFAACDLRSSMGGSNHRSLKRR